MIKEDIEFLEANRQHYNTITQAGFVADLDGTVKQNMLEVIKRNFDPGYLTNLWCSPCVVEMIKYVYTQYDAIPKEEPVKEVEPPKPSEPTIKKETFPKHDETEVLIEPKKRGRKPKS